jgi:indole-3-glycerol phosphate synthase
MTTDTLTYETLQPYYWASLEETREFMEQHPLPVLEARVAARIILNADKFIDDVNDEHDVAVIAEFKRKAPHGGSIRDNRPAYLAAQQYVAGGAVAISVLTQKKYFGGRVEDISLAAAGAAKSLESSNDDDARRASIMRKDFIESQPQLYQAAAFGANAVLLIAAGLEKSQLKTLLRESRDIGISCLVEAHNETDLDKAADAGAKIVALNNRNLVSGKVDRSIAYNLSDLVPEGITLVAASGYDVMQQEHIRELREMGADGVLMGTSLMRHFSPTKALARWLKTDQPVG